MLGNWPVYYTTLYGHPTHPLIMLSIGLSIQQHYWSTHFSPDTARRNLEIDRTVYVDIYFFTFIELLALINWNNWKYNIVTSTFWCCHSSWWHPPASWAWSPPGPSGRRFCPWKIRFFFANDEIRLRVDSDMLSLVLMLWRGTLAFHFSIASLFVLKGAEWPRFAAAMSNLYSPGALRCNFLQYMLVHMFSNSEFPWVTYQDSQTKKNTHKAL